jgi:ferredoxin-type protein NapH
MFIVPILNLLEIYFIRGTFISMDIGALAIADPVMILQTVFAKAGLAVALLGSVVIPILITVMLGRVWCSWVCPYSTLMEWLERIPFIKKLTRKNHKKIMGSQNLRKVYAVRYILFLFLLMFVGMSGIPLLHLISPPAVLSSQALLIFKASLTIEILFVILMIFVELFLSYRFVCRYICPTGTCLSFFNTKATLRPTFSGSCIDCGLCTKNCPMGLEPRTDSGGRLCYNCGKCIDICPDKSKPLTWKI